ncbi:MAG: hypothetical protein KF678_08745 [Phycisphaeraceae bacterium]|nr:hypothetical protein [Phycisphaeraceae bacterium]
MIVKVKSEPPQQLCPGIHVSLSAEDLEANGLYLVYGVLVYPGGVSFYLCARRSDPCPYPFAGFMFEFVQTIIPSGWRMGRHVRRFARGDEYFMGPAMWAQDETFYERLVDGDGAAEMAFKVYAEELRMTTDHEFIA